MADIRGFRELTVDEKNSVTRLLVLQANVEYGFYYLYIPWQSADHTSSEQRWRVSRMVSEEVSHGLNMIRLLKAIGSKDQASDLESIKFGDCELPVFNSALKTWDELVAFNIIGASTDLMNLEVLKESSVNELKKYSSDIYLQQSLHVEYGINSLEEITNGDSKLGSLDGVKNELKSKLSVIPEVYRYGGRLEDISTLGISYSPVDEIKSVVRDRVNALMELHGVDLKV